MRQTLPGWLACALLVAACGGGSGVGTSPPVAAPEPAPPAAVDTPGPGALAWAVSHGTRPENASPLVISAIDPVDGTLRPVHSYAPGDLGGLPMFGPVTDPLGRFMLFGPPRNAADAGAVPVSVTVGAGGALQRGATSAAGIDITGMVIVPSGRFAYAPTGDGRVRGYAVGATGQLQELAGSPFGPPAREGTFAIAAHPAGAVLYIDRIVGPLQGIDQYRPVAAFRIDAATGALQPVVRSPAPAVGEAPGNEAGRILLAGSTHAWVLRQDGSWLLHTVDAATGQLAPAASGAQIASWQDNLAMNAAGTALAVSSGFAPASLRGYRFDAASGTLTAVGDAVVGSSLQPFTRVAGDFLYHGDVVLRLDPAAGLQVMGVARLPGVSAVQPRRGTGASHAALYALDRDAARLRILRGTAAADGTLAEQASLPLEGTPVDLVAWPGQHLLATVAANGAAGGTLSVFRIDRATGGLRLLATAPTGAQPTAVAASDGTPALFVSHASGIDAFAVDGATGALQKAAGSPYPVGYRAVPTPPDGSDTAVRDRVAADLAVGGGVLFIAANQADGNGEISTQFVADGPDLLPQRTGLGSCQPTFGPPLGATFSASGRNTVAVTLAGPGRLVYALNRDANTIAGYRATGGFCWRSTEAWMPPITGSPFATAGSPVAFTTDPQARYLFVAHAGSAGSVSAWEIDASSGALRPVGGSIPLGHVPARIWTDPTGRFLYTADAAGTVSVQAVDRASGLPGPARPGLAGARAHLAVPVVHSIE